MRNGLSSAKPELVIPQREVCARNLLFGAADQMSESDSRKQGGLETSAA